MTNPFRVVLIDHDGAASIEVWDVPDLRSIKQLGETVGGEHGSIECVNLRPALDMWVGGMSKLEHPEPNPVATAIARSTGLWQDYYGPAVLVGVNEATGATLPLSETLAAWYMRQIRAARRGLGLD